VKSSRKHLNALLLALPLLMFMASSVEEEHQVSDPMVFVGKVVNFVVLFGGLGFLLSKPLKKFLESRGQEIDRSIRETRESREASEARLEEAGRRLEVLTGEMDQVQSEAENQGRVEKKRIIGQAQEEARRLKQLAQQEIGLVSQTVTRELREYAAGLATEQARERIRAKMTPERQAQMIDNSIDRLERLYEKSSSD
jgi:F-type H+-transporting ATPase subunit b